MVVAVTAVTAVLLAVMTSACAEDSWPARVLVTNDNGIDDPGLIELARALALVTETHVVAPATDQSGMSNLMSAVRKRQFRVEKRDIGAGIDAYALDGTPADCVIFGLAGPLRDRLPDLVISGINGGPNLADDWFGSGTIGAARCAAYFGFPAIAVSGLDDDDPDAVRAVVDWVVALAQSEAARGLRAPQYLTVSVPVVHPSSIEGVEVVTRARGLVSGTLVVDSTVSGDGEWQTWRLSVAVETAKAPKRSDVDAAARNMIAVVPMRVDESDPALGETLQARADLIPAWVPPPAPPSVVNECPSGLGIVIDDAEDSSGREWGVVIEEVLPKGRAAEIGLRTGDVIVALNGTPLETPRGSREDPVDVITRLLGELWCGDTVTLDYVRNNERRQVDFIIPDKRQR
jgi:5'-nucleotidase